MPTRSAFQKMVFVGIVFFALSCGQRGMPTGGAKDDTPPKIKSSSPENFSTNFQGKEIEIKFDEYVQVKGFQKEFLISPPVAAAPTYRLRGKRLILEFDSAFAPNTTYTLFFGKSIVDLNEANPLDSNIFVFSTGDIIDSLTLSGKMIDAQSLQPETEMMVLLYKNLADSAPQTVLPSYFAPVKDGSFDFSNLAEGTYRIFALKDANQNYRYDLPTEKIAFLPDPIRVPFEDSVELVLQSFVAPPSSQKVFKPSSPKVGYVQTSFTLPPDSVYVEDLQGDWPADSLFEYWNPGHDTLTWISSAFTEKRGFKLLIHADTVVSDTANLTISKKESGLEFTGNFFEHVKNNFNDTVIWTASEPIDSFPDSVFVVGAGDSSYVAIKRGIRETDLILEKGFLPGEDYQIYWEDSVIVSVLGHYNAAKTYRYNMESEGAFGQLIFGPKVPSEAQYIIQLYLGQQLIATRIVHSGNEKLTFKGLRAGEYQINLIVDEQKDGRWSPGKYQGQVLPEQVIRYPKPITIRANWDLELDWELE